MTTHLFAVTGNPILHSKSPDMHNAALRELGIDATYTRLAATSAKEAMQTAREIGMSGLNITSPFKEEFAKLADGLDNTAEYTDAVNTLIFKEGKTQGHNTDVIGIQRAFAAHNVNLRGKKVILLGAGGAARAAILTLRKEGADVIIVNRTKKKAEELAKKMNCEVATFDTLGSLIPDTDAIISTLSTTKRVIPKHYLQKEMVVLDAYYAKETTLAHDAKKAGCTFIDGTEWLLYQGAASFELFTGKKAPVEVMRNALEEKVKNQRGNITLIGFMGSGKTTVAKELARKENKNVIDIDEKIEKEANMTIQDIFLQKGEPHFREKEKEEIEKIKKMEKVVIACGGGVILTSQNRETLQNCTTTIWVWAKPETIFKRIGHDSNRPLLTVPNREEVARRMLQERRGLYARTADLIVSTENKTPKEIAELILHEIH